MPADPTTTVSCNTAGFGNVPAWFITFVLVTSYTHLALRDLNVNRLDFVILCFEVWVEDGFVDLVVVLYTI